MKKRILSLVAILVIMIACTLTGCNANNSNVDLTLSTDTINITLDDSPVEEGEVKNSAKFTVTVSNVENATVLFRIENEDRIRVTSQKINSTTIEATVIGLYPGIAKIYAFTPENSNVFKEVVVNVYQPIKNLALIEGYEVYMPLGGTSSVAVDRAFIITPANGNVSSIKYEIVSDNGRTGLVVNDSGLLDATNAQNEGDVVVRAYVSEEVGVEFTVHVVKALTMADINVQRDGNVIFNGQYVESEFSLVKTVETYQQSELSFAVSGNSSLFEVTYSCDRSGLIEVQSTAYNKFMIKALELGDTAIDFYVNIKGAGAYLEPVKLTFVVKVIDLPLDINLNGESSKANNGVFNMVCYNNYETGKLGTPYRFTLSPSSVLEEDSTITIEFDKPSQAVNALVVMDAYGNRIGVQRDMNGRIISMIPFDIKAGETIYIKASLNRTDNAVFSFTATAAITEVYKPLVSTLVNVTLKEGISEFSYNRNNLYIERGNTQQVTLTVGSDAADKSGITYELNGNSITVEQVNEVSYMIKGIRNGESTITFYSGNGFEIKIKVMVYVPLTNVWITCDDTHENGAIGNKVMENDSLSSVAVVLKAGVKLDVTTNLNATIIKTNFVVVTGSKFVGIDANGYATILGVGQAKVNIEVYGYDENGVMEDPIVKTVTIEGYIPVSSISLNYIEETLMDYESVGYYRVSDFSQLNLNVNVYPTNATINNQDITWSIVGDGGTIQSEYGKNNVFTAGPLGSKDSDVVKVYVTLNDHGRVHSQTCTIYVEKAVKVETIRMVNVFNQDLYFSSQKGLGKVENGIIVDSTNSFNVATTIYPTNAYNKNLRYIYISTEENEESPVFVVDAFGKVVPLRGGNAILRIAAEDSYYEYQSMTTYIDIKVTVADGTSEATAFNIYTAEDLQYIGTNETTLSSYYKLASDIDLSSMNWKPIGSKDNPFTGTLYGYYNVGVENTKLMAKVLGLTINETIASSEDAYYGLFGYVLGGDIIELEVHVKSIKIDASNHLADVYVGGLAGATYTKVIEGEETTYDISEIKDSSVMGDLIEVTPAIGATYLGGMVGYHTGSIKILDVMPIVQMNNIKVLTSSNAINNLYVGGMIGYAVADLKSQDGEFDEIRGSYSPYIDEDKYYRFGSSEGSSVYDVIVNIQAESNTINNELGFDAVKDVTGQKLVSTAIGGVIGYYTRTVVGEQAYISELRNLSAKADINASSVSNIGGVVGYNNMNTINLISFTGNIYGEYNVGGIVGLNIGHLSNAYVETKEDNVLSATDYLGILIGRWNAGLSAYNASGAIDGYLFSSFYTHNGSLACAGEHVGALIGGAQGIEWGEDISTQAHRFYIIGSSSLAIVNGDKDLGVIGGKTFDKFNLYVVGSVIAGLVNVNDLAYVGHDSHIAGEYECQQQLVDDSYSIDNVVTDSGSVSWSVENVQTLVNTNVSGETYKLYNELPSILQVVVEESESDNHIYIDGASFLLYYYDFVNGYEDNVSLEQLQLAKTLLRELNTIDFNTLDYLDVRFDITPSRTIGLYITIEKMSKAGIASIDKMGKLIISGEGWIDVVVRCVGNSTVSNTIRIYLVKKITTFSILDSSSGEGGLEYTEDNELLIRKGESGVFFSQIYNEYKGNLYSTSDFFAIQYAINDSTRNLYEEVLVTEVAYKEFVFNMNDKEWGDFNFVVIYREQSYLVEEVAGKKVVEILGTTYEVNENNIVEIDGENYPVLLVAYSVTLDSYGQVDVNTILNYEDGSFVEAGKYLITAVPLYRIPVLNEVTNKIEYKTIGLNNHVGNKEFNIEIYEGAISLEATIDEAFYSPSDKVVFEVTMVTDTEADELVCTNSDRSLTVNIEEISGEIINGKLVKKYEVETYIDNTRNTETDVFDYRYLESNKLYNIEFSSSLLSSTTVTVPITFIPQHVQRLNLYNNTTSSSINDGVMTYEMQEASIYAIPNKSSIIRVDMYPSYAYADYITITSAEVNGAIIYLEQLIQEESGLYTKLVPGSSYTQDGYGIILQKKSQKKVIDDQTVNLFNGNFFVRAQLSESVDEGTQFPITVNAYKRNSSGQLELATSSIIVLTAVEIPEITISLLNATGSDYVVKGLTTDVQIKVKTTSNMIDYDCFCSVSDMIIDPTKTFDKVIYSKTTTPTKVDGKNQYYNDSIYVGIGVETGKEITIAATVRYLLNGLEERVSTSVNLRVVDYLLTDANLYSFNNETDTLNMYIKQEYRFGVEHLDFEIAPEFEIARVKYQLNNYDEDEYNTYYYGAYNNFNIYRSGSSYYINNSILARERLILKGGEYYSAVTGTSIIDLLVNKCGFVKDKIVKTVGLLQKINKLETNLNNDYSVFYRDIGNNTYQSLSLGINNDYYYYIARSEKDGNEIINLVGTGVATGINIRLDIKYGFNENLELVLYDDVTASTAGSYANLTKDYTINIMYNTIDDVPIPIYNMQQFLSMEEGNNYILMNDIELEDWTAMDARFNSLDGNSYQLIVETFAIPEETTSINLSIFRNISNGSVIKNLTVNLSKLSNLNLTQFTNISFAGLAINNSGTITNCHISATPIEAVGDSGSSIRVETNINLKTKNTLNGTKVKVEAGLMVVSNSGNITNSQVGDIDTPSYTTPLKLIANGEIAGFINENSGHISSCYVINTSLENWFNIAGESRTAGFVNRNNGVIIGSYVRGSKVLYSSTSTDGTNIHRSADNSLASNGNIGGFVYENSAEINNCYSNIKIVSNGRTAGFVFINSDNGVIDACYSTSLVTRGSALHMPFIGVNDESIIQDESVDGITNCFYLLGSGESYESSSLNDPANSIITKSFSDEISFGGFSFSKVSVYDAMWVMQNGYPELVEANNISVSKRILNSIDDRIFYTYESDYDLGTKQNPYLISSAKDFNNYFANNNNGETVTDKYYRFVADIDFDTVSGVNATKGVELCNIFIDGNGFSINNVRINAQTPASSIGLFKRIYSKSAGPTAVKRYSTLKNFNLNIIEASALNVAYMGGLAGVIEDSNVFNVNVASTCVMQAFNVVGGLAGIIEGNSNIFNITSSVSAQAVYKHNDLSTVPTIYNADSINISNISHVGGIAGVLDIRDESLERTELEMTSNSKVKYIDVKGNVSLSGEYVGGAFGYIGKETHVYDVKFELNYEDTEGLQAINSTYSAGGIVGVNFGVLNHVRIEHSISNQELIDASLSQYYLNGIAPDRGKTNLFQGAFVYLGGIAGVNYNGKLIDSYSRVDLIDPNPTGDIDLIKEQYFGGLVGITYAGAFRYVYSTGDILTKQIDGYTYAGGLIGRYNLFGQVTEDSDEQMIELTSVYSINAWDEKNFKVQSRNSGAYVGRIIGFTDVDFDASYLTDSNYVDTMIINDKDIFEVDTSYNIEYFDFVGSGRYASKYKYVLPNKVEGADQVVTKDYTNLFTNSSSDSSLLSEFYSDLSITSKWFVPPDYIYPRLTLAVQKDVDTINNVFDFFRVIKASPYKTFYVERDLDFSPLYEIDWANATVESILAAAETNNWENLLVDDANVGNSFDVVKAIFKDGTYESFFSKNFSGKLMSGKASASNEATTAFIENKKVFNGNIESLKALGAYDVDMMVAYMDYVLSELNLYTGATFKNYEELNREIGVLNDSINATNKTLIEAIVNAVTSTLNNEDSLLGEQNLSTTTVTLSGIRLKADGSTAEVGIFARAMRATFSNIIFEFDGIDTTNNETLKTVGLVVANDEGSYLYDVHVKLHGTHTLTGTSNVGGIIGVANATTALSNCTFTGELILENSHASAKEINLGGIVGRGNYVKLDECYVNAYSIRDEIKPLTATFKLSEIPNRQVRTMVGGLVGYAKTLNVSHCYNGTHIEVTGTASKYVTSFVDVGGVVGYCAQLSMSDVVNLGNITVKNASNVYVGGIAGEILASGINNTNVGKLTDKIYYVDIIVDGVLEANVGGAVGYATTFNSNEATAGMSNNMFVNINVNCQSWETNKSTLARVGGYVGCLVNTAASTSKVFNINYINVFGTIKVLDVSTIYVGGIVGLNYSSKQGYKVGTTNLNYSFVNNYIEIGNLQDSTKDVIKSGYVGGLVGITNDADGSSTVSNAGHFNVLNSVTASKINIMAEKINAGGIAGGMQDSVTNCYIATTISANRFSNMYDNSKLYNIDTLSGVNGKISVSSLYVVDELTMNRNKVSNAYTTTQTFSNTIAKNYIYITQEQFISEIRISKLFNIPTTINDVKVFAAGNVFNPIYIGSNITSTTFEENKYYILDSNITLNATVNNFKGILNGNGKIITTTKPVINEVGVYSAISNLAVIGNVSGYTTLFVNVNNGMIYNIYAEGKLNTTLVGSTGAIVSVNNGLLYSVGSDVRITLALTDNNKPQQNIGSIAGENNGLIFNSYALGGISIYDKDAMDNLDNLDLATDAYLYVGGLVGKSNLGSIATAYTATSMYISKVDTVLSVDVIGIVEGNNYVQNMILHTYYDPYAIYNSKLDGQYDGLDDKAYSDLTSSNAQDSVLFMSKKDDTRMYGYVYLESHEKFLDASEVMLIYTGKENDAASPLLINNYSRLYNVLGKTEKTDTRYFKLVQDIEYNPSTVDGSVKELHWKSTAFTGVIDGNNLNIKNLDYNLNKNSITSYKKNLGMFTIIHGGSTIKNLSISNKGLNNNSYLQDLAGKYEDQDYIYSGALAGQTKGTSAKRVTISNVNVYGITKNSKIYNESLKERYRVYGAYAGGVVGYAEYTDFNSVMSTNSATAFNGRLKNTNVAGSAGGVIGFAYNCNIENCMAYGVTVRGGSAHSSVSSGSNGVNAGDAGTAGGNGIHAGNAGGIAGIAKLTTIRKPTVMNSNIYGGDGGNAGAGGDGKQGTTGNSGTSKNDKHGKTGGTGGRGGDGGTGGSGGNAGGIVGYAINVSRITDVTVTGTLIQGGKGGKGGDAGDGGKGGTGGNGCSFGYWNEGIKGGNGGTGGRGGNSGTPGLGGNGGYVGTIVGANSSTSSVHSTKSISATTKPGAAGANGSNGAAGGKGSGGSKGTGYASKWWSLLSPWATLIPNNGSNGGEGSEGTVTEQNGKGDTCSAGRSTGKDVSNYLGL